MPKVSRSEVIDCDNPKIDVFFKVGGSLTDVSEISWRIFDETTGSVQIEPASGFNALDLADCPTGYRLSLGRYTIPWTVPAAANFGNHKIEWNFKLNPTDDAQTFCEEFTVDQVVAASVGGAYCSVAEARAAGITEALISDEDLAILLFNQSRLIDKYTRRWFEPRQLTLKVDGKGTELLQLGAEIISIDDVKISYSGAADSFEDVELTDLIIYNRHIAGQWLPDDRSNPKIEFNRNFHTHSHSHGHHYGGRFPRGRQNVEVTGTFGYTEYDGSLTGVTPSGISRACLLMAAEILKRPITGSGGLCNDPRENQIKTKRTRDREVQYFDLTKLSSVGFWFSENVEINRILETYMKPTWMAAV